VGFWVVLGVCLGVFWGVVGYCWLSWVWGGGGGGFFLVGGFWVDWGWNAGGGQGRAVQQ